MVDQLSDEERAAQERLAAIEAEHPIRVALGIVLGMPGSQDQLGDRVEEVLRERGYEIVPIEKPPA